MVKKAVAPAIRSGLFLISSLNELLKTDQIVDFCSAVFGKIVLCKTRKKISHRITSSSFSFWHGLLTLYEISKKENIYFSMLAAFFSALAMAQDGSSSVNVDVTKSSTNGGFPWL